MARPFEGEIKLDVRESRADWAGVPREPGAEWRAERAGRPLRRHRPGGMVAVWRSHQHADDAAAGRQRTDVHAMAHHCALLADAA